MLYSERYLPIYPLFYPGEPILKASFYISLGSVATEGDLRPSLLGRPARYNNSLSVSLVSKAVASVGVVRGRDKRYGVSGFLPLSLDLGGLVAGMGGSSPNTMLPGLESSFFSVLPECYINIVPKKTSICTLTFSICGCDYSYISDCTGLIGRSDLP